METMARPRLGESERRTRTIGVRVTEAEETELRERAQAVFELVHRSLPAPPGGGPADAERGFSSAGSGGDALVETGSG